MSEAAENRGLRILVVDDEDIVRESLTEWLRDDGHQVSAAPSARDALRLVAEQEFDVALVDIKMPRTDGLELQARLKEKAPNLSVIIMTAYASVESAVRALKGGAYDYVVKPFDPDELSHLLRRTQEHRSLRTENMRLKQSLEASGEAREFIGVSTAAERVRERIDTVASTECTVLVQGESGTGKELVAQAVHRRSSRRYNPLVVVHCGALAEGVLESELFGHEKGAFTGARYHHKGKFEQADGGTVFLDEIGDISPQVQVELLRVLEEKAVVRVGGRQTIPVDFRIIAATNQDLEACVRAGTFREDLFWRINVVSIWIPPIRERIPDIPVLANHFLERFCRNMSKKPKTIGADAMEALLACPWPGNVRQLKNAIESAVVLGKDNVIGVGDLPDWVVATADRVRPRTLADIESSHVRRILDEVGGNVTEAARILGVDRGTLYNKIKKFGIPRSADDS
ncbi:MAG: sigma-54-dependent Fis family transcriptional regulator [Planctomycetes bacterium]|nr:sigma-54-dependent Fis family transcriptional regulator [Planctomycetota bacterium]